MSLWVEFQYKSQWPSFPKFKVWLRYNGKTLNRTVSSIRFLYVSILTQVSLYRTSSSRINSILVWDEVLYQLGWRSLNFSSVSVILFIYYFCCFFSWYFCRNPIRKLMIYHIINYKPSTFYTILISGFDLQYCNRKTSTIH